MGDFKILDITCAWTSYGTIQLEDKWGFICCINCKGKDS